MRFIKYILIIFCIVPLIAMTTSCDLLEWALEEDDSDTQEPRGTVRLSISSFEWTQEGPGSYEVSGIVYNYGTRYAKGVEVHISFYDSAGNWLGSWNHDMQTISPGMGDSFVAHAVLDLETADIVAYDVTINLYYDTVSSGGLPAESNY